MAVTHSTAVRNILADAAVDEIDLAAGSPDNGTLVLLTSGDVEVATLLFADPAFGNAAAGIATANAIADDTNATGGTMAKFEIRDGDGNVLILGSVGTSGQDINFNSVIVSAGQTVSVTSLTYAAAA